MFGYPTNPAVCTIPTPAVTKCTIYYVASRAKLIKELAHGPEPQNFSGAFLRDPVAPEITSPKPQITASPSAGSSWLALTTAEGSGMAQQQFNLPNLPSPYSALNTQSTNIQKVAHWRSLLHPVQKMQKWSAFVRFCPSPILSPLNVL